MSMGHVKLSEFARVSRHDSLAAMDLLPEGAELSIVGRGVPFIVAQGFDSAHHVLVTDADSYGKPWIVRQVIVDGLGENLFTTDGTEWLARRKPVAPIFGLNNLEALAQLMFDTVEQSVSQWGEGEIDIQAEMTDLTLEVALRGLLGVDADADGLAADVRKSFEEILEWITYRFTQPLSPPLIAPTPRNRRLRQSKSDLHDAIRALVAHRRKSAVESFDILGQLLNAQDAGADITDQAIVDECAGFMFAGHETTASTLTWALYELSLRPELQATIAAEGEALAVSAGGLVEGLGALNMTESVMKETLRMYPAGISIVRSAKRRTELAGRKVRKGTLVMIPVYTIQRSPELWENPNEFDPTRESDEQTVGYLPFGLGPRRCLGARFARTEMQIAIARICSRWQLSYDQADPPRPVAAPSLRAEGELPLTISRLDT